MNALLIGPENPHFVPHLRTLQQLPEIDAIALAACVPDEAALLPAGPQAKVAARHGRLSTEALRWADVVLACPRNDRAVDIICAALRAGRPVLAEKPLGRNARETAQMVDCARATQQQLGVCYTNRLHPAAVAARAFVQQGLLGALMHVELRWFTTQPRFRDPAHWLFDPAKAGGGIVQWLGCHLLDLAAYITGVPLAQASAMLGTRSGEPIGVEDVAALALRFENGAVGSLACGYVLAQAGAGYENRSGNDSHVAIIGTRGRMVWCPTATPCIVQFESTGADPSKWTLNASPIETPSYGGAYGEAFVRAFLQGTPIATGDDALRIARLLDTIYSPHTS
jgi:predicted dehydrogenase